MKVIDLNRKTILISRTDSIGDVILTLPICSWIKANFEDTKIIFLGKSYTVEVLQCFPFIDHIVELNEWEAFSMEKQATLLAERDVDVFIHVFPNKHLARLANKAKIPFRIGTSHRLYHLTTCNVRPNFTRKKSDKHEAQLNFSLLENAGVNQLPSIDEIKELMTEFKPKVSLNGFLKKCLERPQKKIILHTKSQGSAVEWPIENYIELAHRLVAKEYTVYFSGTEKEGKQFRSFLPDNDSIIDISGRSSLGEFITFISQCDALVACSTGPLHIAAVLGIKAIGLYTDLRPMHPGRWAPIGKNSIALTADTKKPPQLEDIHLIKVEDVLEQITRTN
ncbi:glycosyl transferase family 9 [Brumimicrobium salinarum]|uniref:Glycosyl transferase family 9 n=1 Tax=Brumimicrobium salinarum TaxID=2058658 RepID=A0A2I0R5U0_9FLAO|nr:glycosyltransferase family 9 protein [Brumimicrobium salinarum]PKR81948.1 glycosyl transferase family 9 [Brumimicrobium salinarum]